MATLSIPELIIKKRDAKELSKEEVYSFVRSVANGSANTAQAGAMLMAMYLRGLSPRETEQLTRAMVQSGDVLTWPERWRHLVVDKHSTGGVGDKISLALAPALAACGLKVPMISGRGLGYTGGTLDKLEAIPGFQVMRSQQQILDQLEDVGCCIVGQTEKLVPADKVLYAIRDTTGTVDNMSLVTASILSKKAAESVNALVMEVTVGSGAPFTREEDARKLARMLIDLGRALGIKTTAMLFRMDDPVGHMIGNSLEVMEAIECLQGRGPDDLHNCVCQMGGRLLLDARKCQDFEDGQAKIARSLRDGSAKQKFIDMAVAQGVEKADAYALFRTDGPKDILPTAKRITEFRAPRAGYVANIDALSCGMLAHQLGAGRQVPGEQINYAVGLETLTHAGNSLQEGDVWVKVHHDAPLTIEQTQLMANALTITDDAPSLKKLLRIFDVLE